MLLVERKGDAVAAVHADGARYGEAQKPAEIEAASDAFLALRQYGFKEGEIRPVLAEVRAACGALPVERMVVEALKRIGKAARTYTVHPSGAGRVGELVEEYVVARRPTWDGGEGGAWASA